MTILTLDRLNRCSEEEFLRHLGSVFEHAPWVAGRILPLRPFPSVAALHGHMLDVVRRLPEDERIALLSGHPDLAGADARKGTMTADSIAEQGTLALAQLTTEENAAWDRLNGAYRSRFGFPFILCIRRHTRASALRAFERRLNNDRATEMASAVDEIGRVTRLRLAARIAGHALPAINGRLTLQVLDRSAGRAAGQLRMELQEVLQDGRRTLVEAVTNDHGRPDEPLLQGEPLRMGRYELQLHVGDYFRAQGLEAGDTPFLDVVPVAFGIDDAEGDYHLPVSITPSSYTVARSA